jgi:DNA gyrase subunit A
LEVLYKHTPLESGFSINMVAIADGKPQQMGLLDIIAYYTAYQREVVLKRSKYELEEAKEREHIISGLVIAVNNIDEVIKIIKTADSVADARQKLRIRFDLSEKQAQAILDLRLARITKLEVSKLQLELKELQALIGRLNVIINSKQEQMNVVKNELLTIKRNHKVARRSEILGDTAEVIVPSEDDQKPVENVAVALFADNSIKRVPIKNFNMSNKDALNAEQSEVVTYAVDTLTDSKVMFFSNYGNCFQADVDQLPECKFRDKGVTLSALFSETTKGEVPVAAFAMGREDMPKGEIVIFTRQGMAKRSSWEEYKLLKSSFLGYKGKEGDEVFRVESISDAKGQIFYVTNKGGCTKFDVSEIPLQGRVAGGVKCITLADDEYVVFAGVAKENESVLMVTDKGYVKRLKVSEISKHARNCKGAKGIEFGQINGKTILHASVVTAEAHCVAISDHANTIVVNTDDVAVEGKNTKGKLPKGKRGAINVERVVYFKVAVDDVFREKK